MNNFSPEDKTLDQQARNNLTEFQYREYLKYKDSLKNDEHTWDGDAEHILIGFIWECLEGN